MQISINTTDGDKIIGFQPGEITLVVGPNGVGKSAFLVDVYRRLPVRSALYYPGHRQITFSQGWENLSMSLIDLDTNLFSQTEAFNRYKNLWPEEQFKSTIRKLLNLESAHNIRLIERLRGGEDPALVLPERSSPLNILNNVFATGRLPVQFGLVDDGFMAIREGATYEIPKLSDGERASLFLASAIITSPEGSTVIVDEPERHMHPSISAPLIAAAVRARPHSSFMFATHDLNLIETLDVDNIIYIKNSVVLHATPEQRVYDIRAINDLSEISDDLKRDILGARDKVLFVEGEPTSLDMALYAACYPDWKVSPRGGNEKVQEAVKALADNQDLHWMDVVGIVDGDGRDAEEVRKLTEKKIITLPFPSIENLFFIEPVVEEIVKLISSVEGGDPSERMSAIESNIPIFIETSKEEIINRRTTWITNRRLSEAKVSVKEVREGQSNVEPISIVDIASSVSAELEEFLAETPNLSRMEGLPIKATAIPAGIAALAGIPSLKKYKQVVLHQIEFNTVAGQAIRSAIVQRLPVLP